MKKTYKKPKILAARTKNTGTSACGRSFSAGCGKLVLQM